MIGINKDMAPSPSCKAGKKALDNSGASSGGGALSRFVRSRAFDVTGIVLVFASLLILLYMAPGAAYADEPLISTSKLFSTLRWITTAVLLPLGIIIASFKIVYIAIVGGMFGMDPLGFIKGQSSDEVSGEDVSNALKEHFWGFAKGLAWVAGLFIVFQLALSFAVMLADSFENAFG
ncbi:MAG: hypothetical protein BZ138_06405 [Methanosphaera sp. rholeuAM270]|nr:MAG: hypothetical protein BZ138_06405 [Methanosphaera sp. rholeuAM270]